MRCVIRAYAKINLYLDVLERRPDGYHDIETIFQSVGLGDTLCVTGGGDQSVFTCSHPAVPADENNLVLRALHALEKTVGRHLPTQIHLEKHIPVAAGLAGGSADAAGTLLALNQVHGLGLNTAQLQEIAAQLGSDVPFCCVGGTVAATGRGERLRALPPFPTTWVVLVHVPRAVSTAWVYNHPDLPRNPAPRIHGLTEKFARLLAQFPNVPVPQLLYNSMESVVFRAFPEVEEARNRLLACPGVLGAAMSGSGATVFGLFKDPSAAQEAAESIAFPTSVVQTLDHSIEMELNAEE
jgi:4-diphosphocytidyl-2-C-methyl-D-erythritol kinase